MKTNDNERQKKQDRFIVALLTSATIGEACKLVPVSKAKAYEWLKEPGFQEAYRQARQDSYVFAISRLHAVMAKAVTVLEGLLDSDKDYVRAQAANSILSHGQKGFEMMDVLPRLEALEKAIDDDHTDPRQIN